MIKKLWKREWNTFIFTSKKLNWAYFLLICGAILTHPLILSKCSYCLDVPFWYKFVLELPLATQYIDLAFLNQVILALIVGLAIFGAETLRDSIGILRARLFAKNTEIIPLFGMYAAIVLLNHSCSRVVYLLLTILFFLHIICAYVRLIVRLFKKNLNNIRERAEFREILTELVQANSTDKTSVNEAIGILEEPVRNANTALVAGNARELDLSYEFIEIYADISKVVNNEKLIKSICQENISLARSASSIARVDLQQFVARKLFVLMGYGLRVVRNENVNKEMVMSAWNGLSILMWPDIYGNKKINSEPILSVIELMFRSHIRWYMSYELEGDVTKVTAQTKVLLDGCVLLSFQAIQNHDHQFVAEFVKLIGNFGDMNIDSETSKHPISVSQKYQRIATLFDNAILQIASMLLLAGVLNDEVYERALTACYEALAVPLGFTTLENAVHIWSNPRSTHYYDAILHETVKTGEMLKDESSQFEMLATMLLLSKVKRWKGVSLDWSGKSICTTASIQRFGDSLNSSLTWIKTHEAYTNRFVENITGEIQKWVLLAVQNLIEQSTINASSQ